VDVGGRVILAEEQMRTSCWRRTIWTPSMAPTSCLPRFRHPTWRCRSRDNLPAVPKMQRTLPTDLWSTLLCGSAALVMCTTHLCSIFQLPKSLPALSKFMALQRPHVRRVSCATLTVRASEPLVCSRHYSVALALPASALH
jgi:hypothetical protein